MHTLNKVKGDTLKVAYSENEIWIQENKGKVIGIEANIIKEFANAVNAEVEWIKGAESELIPLLKEGECHIFICGLTKSSPWKKHAGFTRPYTTSKIYIGISPGITVPESIKDKKIAVKKNNSIGKYIKRKGGIPEYTDSLEGYSYIATYEREIKQLGYILTDIKLHEEKQVIAVPQGENAFLIELENFLDSHVKIK